MRDGRGALRVAIGLVRPCGAGVGGDNGPEPAEPTRMLRATRRFAALVLALTAVVSATISATADARTSPGSFAFQPITMQRIDLPARIHSASSPEFTHDGRHLLFWSGSELWITNLSGRDVRCLSCGVAHDPKLVGPGTADLATPFPDGRRVLIEEDQQPTTSRMAVLECTPSLIDCRDRRILPVDFSGAEPAVIPPGGAVGTPQETLVGGAYHAKLSQDGNYVGFSEVRSDVIEAMVVGRLKRDGAQYVVSDARVINPPAPTSSSDPNTAAWSNSAALYEFKTFTDGGADATYAESGGPSLLNPDVWSVNLATGRRTRLTSNADWDEDNGVSPNGKLLSLFSDRTMHYVDWLGGLLPVQDFIDAPASAMSAGSLGGSSECMGPMWLLPSSGDDGGSLAGEPIVDYRYPGVHVVDNFAGWSQWSPNGTMIALNTVDTKTGLAAPFVLVAHLTAVKPSKPLRPVSSQPGSWAPLPAAYHGAMGFDGNKVLHGTGGGTVTVTYGGAPGELSGQWSETYAHYSDNGTDFVNGTAAIIGGPLSGGTYTAHLTMTGAITGTDNADVTFGSTGTSGHADSTYDGHTVTGPSAVETRHEVEGGPQSACPSRLPKQPALQVTTTKLRHDTYRVRVTASVAGVGPDEAEVDVQPVFHAALTLGRARIYTDRDGLAIVTVGRAHRLTVTAGDTLKATHAQLR